MFNVADEQKHLEFVSDASVYSGRRHNSLHIIAMIMALTLQRVLMSEPVA